jgi:hypothetical protein
MSENERVQVKFTTSRAQREALKAEAYRRGIPTYRLLREQVALLTGVHPDPIRPYTRPREAPPTT